MTAETMIALSESNQRRILDATPGSCKEIAEKTGIARKTVDSIIKKLIRAEIVMVTRYEKWGNTHIKIAIYDEVATARVTLKAPATQYRTQWINGAHPCQQYNPFSQAAA